MIPSRAPDKDPNSAAEIFTIVRLSCETWVTLAHYQLVISPTKSLGHRAVHLRLFLSLRGTSAQVNDGCRTRWSLNLLISFTQPPRHLIPSLAVFNFSTLLASRSASVAFRADESVEATPSNRSQKSKSLRDKEEEEEERKENFVQSSYEKFRAPDRGLNHPLKGTILFSLPTLQLHSTRRSIFHPN